MARRIAWIAAVLAATLALLTSLTGTTPLAAVRHSGWYMFASHNQVPMWISAQNMFVDFEGNYSGDGPQFVVERVEKWGLSSKDARSAFQDYDVLTDSWRATFVPLFEAGETDDPLVTSYRDAYVLAAGDLQARISDDVLIERLGVIPTGYFAAGCKPAIGAGGVLADWRIFYNTAPYRFCDAAVGLNLWLLVIAAGTGAALWLRARRRP